MENVEQTLISQYANSPIIKQLITGFNACVDQSTNFDMFYSYVWDVMTAQGFGLDIWGRIVDVSRTIQITPSDAYFGFKDGGYKPFNQAPFYNRATADATTSVYVLSDEAYRTLILVKALTNISDSSARTTNTLLRNLFAGRGDCWVRDLGGMQMEYRFLFVLEPFEIAILTNSGAIFHPAGVGVSIVIIPNDTLLGFAEAESYEAFGYGTLYIG